jgi:hypothetical protein
MTGPSIQNRSLVAVGLVFICAAAAYYVYSNLWPEYTAAKSQLTAVKSENDNLTKAFSSMQDFIETYDGIGSRAANADLFLPTKNPDLSNFINNLASIAAQSGVTLSGFQTTDAPLKAPNNAIQSLDVSFTSSGSYLSMKAFLLNMQNNLRLMDIYSVSMNAAQASAGTPILQFQVKLRTYFQQ